MIDASRIEPALGADLRSWRVARGWTTVELGRRIGVSDVAVLFWERGRNRPTRRHLLALRDLGFRSPLVEVLLIPQPPLGDACVEEHW